MEENRLDSRTEIIAEVANAHQGNPKLAKKLAHQSLENGADAIKFQIYFADELLSNKHPRFKHFKNQSFSEKIWVNLLSKFKKYKKKIYCDVFGEKAFYIAKSCNVDGFKIHSSDLNNDILLKLVAKSDKKIFLSAGGSTLEEIAYAIKVVKYTNSKIKPVILHGFQSYPTKINNCDLFKIKLYKNLFGKNCEIGYQDHLSASNPLNYKIPILASKLGAKYLEKHVTLDRSKKGVDYYSSLEPKELKKFIQLVHCSGNKNIKIKKSLKIDRRNLKLAMGEANLESMSLAERNYRENVKKVWFLKKKIIKGQYVKKNNLIMKRPVKNNIHNLHWDIFKNKKSKINISTKNHLTSSMFKNDITAIVVARNNSKRLKNKAIKKICDYSTIEHLFRRVKQSKIVDRVILCTTQKKEDDILINIAKKNKILYFRGDNKNVLKRMLDSIKKIKTDIIIRITGDDILIDPHYLDKTINYHLENNLQYTDAKNLPSGIDTEIFNRGLLETIYKLAKDSSETEYLTYYVSNHKNQFKTGSLNVKDTYRKKIRLTMDNKKDFKVIKIFLENMKINKKLFNYKFNDLINFFNKNKSLFKQNQIRPNRIKKINTNFDWKRLFN